MNKKLRILIIGGGAMAWKHASAYRAVRGVELAAVANRGEARGRALCAEFGIPAFYSNIDRAILESGADIVSVCLPTMMHPDVTMKAMALGMHVLCEKPIALTLADANRMILEAVERRRKFSVVFNRRFNDVYEVCRSNVVSIGAPIVYNTQDIRSIRPKLAMHSRSQNGGPIIDCCVHDFDMLLHLFGKPVSVFATGDVLGRNHPSLRDITDLAVDTAHINVTFENGNRGYLLYSWGLPPGSSYWQYHDFIGPKGVIRLMGEFGEELHQYGEDGRLEVIKGLDNGHERIVQGFVKAVLDEGDVPVQPKEAVDALRLSLAAIESIETGHPVKVHL